MKKITVILVLVIVSGNLFGQEVSVEKSIWSAQVGLFGIWGNSEVRLSNKFTLRSEVGVSAQVFLNSTIYGDGFYMKPEVVLQPRYYYNLNRRNELGRDIQNNSGNYLGLKLEYNPDWFMVSNAENYENFNQFVIIPGWGLRRNLGKVFFYEAEIGTGFGYRWNNTLDNTYQFLVDLNIRIGLRIR